MIIYLQGKNVKIKGQKEKQRRVSQNNIPSKSRRINKKTKEWETEKRVEKIITTYRKNGYIFSV